MYRSADKIQAGRVVWHANHTSKAEEIAQVGVIVDTRQQKQTFQAGTTTLAFTRGLAFLLYASTRVWGGSEGSEGSTDGTGLSTWINQMWVTEAELLVYCSFGQQHQQQRQRQQYLVSVVKISGREKHLAHRNNRLTQRTACTACLPTIMQAISCKSCETSGRAEGVDRWYGSVGMGQSD